MATAARIAAVLVALVGAATPVAYATPAGSKPEPELSGNAGHVPDSTKPKVTAAFAQESYRPGELARLVITDHAAHVDVRFFRAGGESGPTLDRDVMRGTPVSQVSELGAVIKDASAGRHLSGDELLA